MGLTEIHGRRRRRERGGRCMWKVWKPWRPLCHRPGPQSSCPHCSAPGPAVACCSCSAPPSAPPTSPAVARCTGVLALDSSHSGRLLIARAHAAQICVLYLCICACAAQIPHLLVAQNLPPGATKKVPKMPSLKSLKGLPIDNHLMKKFMPCSV